MSKKKIATIITWISILLGLTVVVLVILKLLTVI